MKNWLPALMALICVWSFAACASDTSVKEEPAAVTNKGASGGTTPVIFDYVYVANYGDSTVSAFKLDPNSGALSLVGTRPTGGSNPTSLAVDSQKKYLFVGNTTGSTVTGFGINSGTGALSAVPGSPFEVAPSTVEDVVIDPLDRFLYVPSFNNNQIQAFSINMGTGFLTSVGTVAVTNAKRGVVEPQGKWLYITEDQVSANVHQYNINQVTGALTSGPQTFIPAGPNGLAVLPGGAHLFTANWSNNTVSHLSLDSAVTGNTAVVTPHQTVTAAYDLTVTPGGNYLYASNLNGGAQAIYGYSIDGAGVLASLGTPFFAGGGTARAISVHPNGKFVMQTDGTSNQLWVYAISATTGLLTPVAGTPIATGTNPYDVIGVDF